MYLINKHWFSKGFSGIPRTMARSFPEVQEPRRFSYGRKLCWSLCSSACQRNLGLQCKILPPYSSQGNHGNFLSWLFGSLYFHFVLPFTLYLLRFETRTLVHYVISGLEAEWILARCKLWILCGMKSEWNAGWQCCDRQLLRQLRDSNLLVESCYDLG